MKHSVIRKVWLFMEFPIYELSDNRFLGIKVFEVLSFPSSEVRGKHIKDFSQLLTELYKLSGEDCVWEFLWLTEEVPHQTFVSRVRVFGVIRKIAVTKQHLEVILENVYKNFMNSLSALQFSLSTVNIETEEWKALMSNIKDACMYAVVKSEKCVANAYSPYAYYYSDVVPGQNDDNFSGLLTTLSQNKKCCVSFQLFPTSLCPEEFDALNEMSVEFGRIMNGYMVNGQLIRDEAAAVPHKVYDYYKNKNSAPLFLYNILVCGEKTCCASIATKLISLLQSGENSVGTSDFACFDLTEEQLKLDKQFAYYPWNINSRIIYNYRNQQLVKMLPLAQCLYRLPYLMSVEEAVAIFRLPFYEKNMTMIKNNQTLQVQEQFSDIVVNENNIQLGTLITNDDTQIVIGCPEQYFTQHALIVGKPGQGKTTFMLDLLLQFVERQIPFLAIEPTKAEYRAMIDAIPDLQIFTPGNNLVSPYIVNPFIPPKGIRVEQYIPGLISAFAAAFDMDGPLKMLFLKAVRASYMHYGWKDYSKYGDDDVIVFGMYEFILVFKEIMNNMGYARDVKNNLESAGLLRLMNLIEQNSNIYDTVHTVPIEDLLSSPTVIELNAIENEEQKSLIMAILLINICVYTKHKQVRKKGLKNIILIDEAHVLLEGKHGGRDNGADSSGMTIQTLRNMIVEIRAYGIGILIADQMPSRVGKTIVANTELKVSFQLVDGAEKDLIAESTDMDVELRNKISKLQVGEACVHYGKIGSAQVIRCRDIRKEKGIRLWVPDTEVAERMNYWEQHAELLKPYKECELCESCKETCDLQLRSKADYIAGKALYQYRAHLNGVDEVKKCVFHLPNLLKEDFIAEKKEDVRKLQICARIKFIRKVCMELPIKVECSEIRQCITQFPSSNK